MKKWREMEVVKHWSRVPEELWKSPSLEILQHWLGKTPSKVMWLWRWLCPEWRVGPGSLQSSLPTWITLWFLQKGKSRPFSKVSCYSTRGRSLAAFFIRLPACFCGVGEKDLQSTMKREKCCCCLPEEEGADQGSQPWSPAQKIIPFLFIQQGKRTIHVAQLCTSLWTSLGCPVSILIFLLIV